MKLLLVNDLHLASAGPATRLDDWHATVERKLDFVTATAESRDVDAICIAGDIFHKTSLAFSSGAYAPMTAALERFQTWELLTQRRVLVIAGNHDVPHNRVDLARQSAFGALVASGTINPVWNEPALIGDGWVGGICYPVTEAAIRGWSQKIRERGLAGRPGVMMLHCFADMVGGDIFGEPSFPYLSLAQWLPEASVFHFGHDHQDKGVTRLGDKVFVQVGALLRGTLAEDQVSRQPKLVVVKTHGAAPLLDIPAQVEVEEIPVPIEPAEKVFDLAKREKVVEASTQIDNFVAHLAEVTAQSAGAQVVDVNQLQISEGAKRLVRRYLDHAMGAA